MKSIKGFTLIEVMITVVIIGILAAIAIPSYSQYIQKTRRTDATESLLRVAALQERWFFGHNQYTTTLTALDTNANRSTDGYYTISMTGNANSYELTATATGAQLKDTDCNKFTINQAGVKGAKNSADVSTRDTCWGK